MRNGGVRLLQGPPDLDDLAGMSPMEKAEHAAENIADIAKDHDLLDVQEIWRQHPGGDPRRLTFDEVVNALKSYKLPKGLHPDDPPRQVLKNKPEIFAPALLVIFNKCFQTCTWPKKWKLERANYINKKSQPETLKDMRNVVLTYTFSKVFESLARVTILGDIMPNLHRGQFGGLSGVSADFLMSNIYQEVIDSAESGYASALLCWDFSRAFDSMSRHLLIRSAARLGLRPDLIRLIASYLDQREVSVNWDGVISSGKITRGGSGQGTLLSVILFIIAADDLLVNLDVVLDAYESGTPTSGRSKVVLFCDDLSVLLKIPHDEFPENALGRRQFVSDGRVEAIIKGICDFSTRSKLRLNKGKTQLLHFDYSQNKIIFESDCFSFPDGGDIEAKDEIKLLGNVLQPNLKFDRLVQERAKAGHYANYQLRRLKDKGVAPRHLINIFNTYVRSKVEYGLVAAYPMLNEGQWAKLERVQRKATRIILGGHWASYGPQAPTYEQRLEELGMVSLRERMSARFVSYSQKCEQEERFERYFVPHVDSALPRRTARDYDVPLARTERRKSSPFISMVNVLNGLPTSRTERRNNRNTPPDPDHALLLAFENDIIAENK